MTQYETVFLCREEKESTSTQLENLCQDLTTASSQLTEMQSALDSTREELSVSNNQVTQLGQDLGGAKEQVTQLTKDKESQQELIGKVRTLITGGGLLSPFHANLDPDWDAIRVRIYL